jgi:hypothetical protein
MLNYLTVERVGEKEYQASEVSDGCLEDPHPDPAVQVQILLFLLRS